MTDDGEDILALIAKAERARSHAKRLTDDRAVRALNQYAQELEEKAAELRKQRSETPVLPEKAADAPRGEPEIGPELAAAMKPPISSSKDGD